MSTPEDRQNLQSILHETRLFAPATEFGAAARVTPARLGALRAEAEKDNTAFWARLGREELAWRQPFSVGLDETRAPNYAWFTDGLMNVSYNCLDRHLEKRSGKIAIIAEGEKGDVRRLTYHELHTQV